MIYFVFFFNHPIIPPLPDQQRDETSFDKGRLKNEFFEV
jgi:hypothetical protein